MEIARLKALLKKQAGEPRTEGAYQEIAPEFEAGEIEEKKENSPGPQACLVAQRLTNGDRAEEAAYKALRSPNGVQS